jgi:hypothetical protein
VGSGGCSSGCCQLAVAAQATAAGVGASHYQTWHQPTRCQVRSDIDTIHHVLNVEPRHDLLHAGPACVSACASAKHVLMHDCTRQAARIRRLCGSTMSRRACRAWGCDLLCVDAPHCTPEGKRLKAPSKCTRVWKGTGRRCGTTWHGSLKSHQSCGEAMARRGRSSGELVLLAVLRGRGVAAVHQYSRWDALTGVSPVGPCSRGPS